MHQLVFTCTMFFLYFIFLRCVHISPWKMHQFVLYIYYFLYFSWRWGSSTAHEKCISLYLLVLCFSCIFFFLGCVHICTAHEKCISLYYIFTCTRCISCIFLGCHVFLGVGGVVLPMENVSSLYNMEPGETFMAGRM